jgi:cytochrome P450
VSAPDYDPYSEEAMVDPHRLYAALRAHDPVHRLEQYDAWALAGFDGVWQACSDTASFSVLRGQTPNQVLLGEPAMNLTFPELDPPEHRLRRRALAHAYTREAAAADVPALAALAHEVLTPLLERGSFDAFDDYASVVSARFAARKAGIPDTDVETVRRLLHAAITREPGQRGTSPANGAAMGEVFGHLAGLIATCRADRSLAHGLLADLLDVQVDGAALHDQQIAAELHTLLVTGSETVELASAAALFHLDASTHKREVLDDPGLAPALFAEAVRFDHPTDMLCRVVREDVVVGGHTLRAGQGVLLLWASANRDEREFAHAGVFDVHRRYERDLLFGHGQHRCIGEHVAVRMGTAILGTLLDAIRDYEIDPAGVHRRPGEFLKGFDRMPITVTRR